MKKISLILALLVMIFFPACEADKDIVKVLESVTPSTLSPLSASTFVLTMDDAAEEFQEFTWTEVDFGFSAVVTYTLQFDEKGNDFESPMDVVTVNNDDTISISVGDFNKMMLNKNIQPDAATDLQFRIKASLSSKATPVYSNVVESKVTPYAISFPPIYMCGEAVGGWNWSLYTYKELRSTSPGIYETVAYFNNTGQWAFFRFFKQTDWGPTSWNYPYFTGTVSDLFDGQTDGDQNFRFIGTSGYYKITVNMTTKSVAMEAVAEPVLFMTGGALGGWDWNTNYVQLTWKSNGIFQATTEFSNDIFRFFGQKDWGPVDYRYPWFDEGTVTPLLELNPNDGDNNFRFVGTPGMYIITVNLLDKIVDMQLDTK